MSATTGKRYTREDWLPFEGLTYAEAAARLGATPGAATRAAKRFGIKFKDGRKRLRSPKVPDWKWRRLGMEGLSAAEAAERVGMSPITARAAARRLGFQWRDVRGELTALRFHNPAFRAKAMRGLNRNAIAPKLTGDERAEYLWLNRAKKVPAAQAAAVIGRADLLEAHA